MGQAKIRGKSQVVGEATMPQRFSRNPIQNQLLSLKGNKRMAQKVSNILFAKEQRELCFTLIQLYGNQFSQRDRVIFEMVLRGDSTVNDIANQFNLSGAGVRQICEKTFRRLNSFITSSVKNDAKLQVTEAERIKLRDENEEFRINAALAKDGKISASIQGFKTPLTELGLSKRIIKSLNNYNITTIAGLKQLTFMDFIKLPNIGRTSIAELENVIAKYGITLS